MCLPNQINIITITAACRPGGGIPVPATIKDIAAATGLGLATISKYINGGHVRPENKKLIDEAIARLDYQVNEAARSLKTSQTNTIGVIIPDLNDLFVLNVVACVEDELRRSNYATVLCDCRSDPALEEETVRMLIRRRVDGMINMPVSSSGEHLRSALDRGIPVVLMDRMVSSLRSQVSAVTVNNLEAGRNAVHRLIWYGHQRIGIIVGPSHIITSQERLQGYRQALLNAGITPDESLVEFSDYTLTGGYESAKKLLERNRDMTALFVTNYEMTLGAYTALNELGIRFPDDLSFMGFDDLRLSRLIRPRLAMVTQPMEEIGRTAARLMLNRIHGRARSPEETMVTLPAGLLEGESIGLPN